MLARTVKKCWRHWPDCDNDFCFYPALLIVPWADRQSLPPVRLVEGCSSAASAGPHPQPEIITVSLSIHEH